MPAYAFLLLLLASLVSCSDERVDSVEDVPVRVAIVAVDEHNLPVVVLEEEGGPRRLPIWIGVAEARSIAVEMDQRSEPRPNTHDLAKRLIQGLDGEVERVVVNDLRDGTYFASLYLRGHGETVEIDSRPSDAIAIALRVKAPIFVRESLFDAAHEQGGGARAERRI